MKMTLCQGHDTESKSMIGSRGSAQSQSKIKRRGKAESRKMIFKVLTLFPEVISPYLESSILGRAQDKGFLQVELCQIRDYAINAYGKVDDQLYGGGTGMLMMAEPIWRGWCHCRGLDPDIKPPAATDQTTATAEEANTQTLFMSPRGRLFDQELALSLSEIDELIIICGHYEGVDSRVIDRIGAMEVSMGDYVLTGGELGALTVIDTVSRLIPGVFSSVEVWQEESHASGLLAEPQYTRPANWRGQEVPEVLLSGHEAKINRWRHLSALNATLERRPDLLAALTLTTEEWEELLEFRSQQAENLKACTD